MAFGGLGNVRMSADRIPKARRLFVASRRFFSAAVQPVLAIGPVIGNFASWKGIAWVRRTMRAPDLIISNAD